MPGHHVSSSLCFTSPTVHVGRGMMMTSMYTTALCRSNHLEFEWFKHRKSSCIWHTLHRHWNVWNIFSSRYTKDKHKLASSAKGGIIIIYINSYNAKLCMQGNKSNRYTKISFSFVHVVASTRVVRKLGKQHLNNIDTHTHTHTSCSEWMPHCHSYRFCKAMIDWLMMYSHFVCKNWYELL